MNDVAEEAGWDVEPGDEIASLVEAVGRLMRHFREAAGLRAADFAEALGYGEDQVRKMERGVRIPRPETLDKADEVLGARGSLKAFKEDMRRARYPKKVRELKALEDRAVEVLLYSNHNMHGLLQTQEYARVLFEMWQPAYSPDVVERETAARIARKSIFEREPAPTLSFVQEQVTLERPYGGKMVLRRQLEHLLEVARLRNVTLQVMPTDREEHAGTHPKDLHTLELRYGMIRAQALPP
ncbi:hypothetical protein SGFS_051590 [Streptomyces graminofaciens]|uniref:HTH cro/C1-type domain-containing protein n=1 Tax=Streptomyces graminofaciens TaxID=68212 RepID=A0ABN5VKB2_9ACTN|nr:hypothetical protein SGFS_051590 [Streptomyces graminofaciens]